MEINDNVNSVTYAVNNSIEIIELFCSDEFKYDDSEEYEIILNRLESINKNYEEYMKVEQSTELKIKADILNSFYNSYIEIKNYMEKNPNKKISIKLPKNKEISKLLISLYNKMFIVFDNVEISTDKIFNTTKMIIKQNGKILK